jgi:hypothetical protein
MATVPKSEIQFLAKQLRKILGEEIRAQKQKELQIDQIVRSIGDVNKKWFLLQARIDGPSFKKLSSFARREGIPNSAYLRRLVIKDLKKRS